MFLIIIQSNLNVIINICCAGEGAWPLMQWAYCLSCTFFPQLARQIKNCCQKADTEKQCHRCWHAGHPGSKALRWSAVCSFQLVTFWWKFCLQGSCKAFAHGLEDIFTKQWFNHGFNCGTGWPGKEMGHFWQKTFPPTIMRSHPWWIYSCFVSILSTPTRWPIHSDSLPSTPPIAWGICNDVFSSLWRGLSTMWCLRWWPSRKILSQCHPDEWEG